MAKSIEKNIEDRAARIRNKARMLDCLPTPKVDCYGDPVSYSNANVWHFDISNYDTDDSYRCDCDRQYQEYVRDIQAFNDLLDGIYSMLE